MGSDNGPENRSLLAILRLSFRDVIIASAGAALMFFILSTQTRAPSAWEVSSLLPLPNTMQDGKTPAFKSLAGELYSQATRPGVSVFSRPFNLTSWTARTAGGLHDPDRVKLAEIYGAASSVYEWGLGESTRIAAHVGVQRYTGVDSDAAYVTKTRDESPAHFRFYFADIGKTKKWGRPKDSSLPKIHFNYQIAPLLAEKDAFDVYMVDGQMRVLCAIVAFLHSGQKNSLVLIHDYYHEVHSKGCKDCLNWQWQRPFHVLEQIADLVDHSGGEIAVFIRKPQVTDQQLLELWHAVVKE